MNSLFKKVGGSLLFLATSAGCASPEDVGTDALSNQASSVGTAALCTSTTCGGHGVCKDGTGNAVCTCDEGFTGASCATRGSNFYARTLLVPGMADPDIYKENDDLFFLAGTGNGNTLPIYETNDLVSFRSKVTYNPSAVDPVYDYCYLWAPDLGKSSGKYVLTFSAHRVPNGAACPPANQEVTTFTTSAPDLNLNFGVPQPINPNTTYARSTTATGCLPEGCNKTVRIDSASYDDPSGRWFFYVWFDRGNNISSFNTSAPGTVYNHAGPAVYALPSEEETINEGPEIFKRNGIYYLLFSTGWYNSQYAMKYIMGDSLPALTRERAVRPLSQAMRNAAGALIQSHGHNTVVERRGEYFNIFHQGAFEPAGTFTGRSTYKQRLAFKPDGSLNSLNLVNVRWTRLAGYSYSLDLVLRDGSVVGPCSDVNRIGTANKTVFTGVCPSAGSRMVNKGDIAAFRIYYSNNGTWGPFVEQAYDGGSDDVLLSLPGGTPSLVDLTWNEKQTGAQYSIDVQRRDTGAWVGPCIGVNSVNRSLAWTYSGRCDTPGIDVALSNISTFRLCSAVNGDWAHASCGSTAYDGKGMAVSVSIP